MTHLVSEPPAALRALCAATHRRHHDLRRMREHGGWARGRQTKLALVRTFAWRQWAGSAVACACA